MGVAAKTTHVEHLEGADLQKSRSYSPAVITLGGKIVWLAGQAATEDLNGLSIEHDFDAQARTCFQIIARACEDRRRSQASRDDDGVFDRQPLWRPLRGNSQRVLP